MFNNLHLIGLVFHLCILNVLVLYLGAFWRSPERGTRPKFFAHLQFADDKTNSNWNKRWTRYSLFFFFFLLLLHSVSLLYPPTLYSLFLTRFPVRFPPRANPITVERALKKKRRTWLTNWGPWILCFHPSFVTSYHSTQQNINSSVVFINRI